MDFIINSRKPLLRFKKVCVPVGILLGDQPVGDATGNLPVPEVGLSRGLVRMVAVASGQSDEPSDTPAKIIAVAVSAPVYRRKPETVANPISYP
jgi:hypothetical protein